MSYHEETTVRLECDRKNCGEWIVVSAPDHNECQRKLFDAGWGLSRGKQICPFHVNKLLRKSMERAK
jgi:hypothetical protein